MYLAERARPGRSNLRREQRFLAVFSGIPAGSQDADAELQTPEGWPVYSSGAPQIILFVFRRRGIGRGIQAAIPAPYRQRAGIASPPRRRKTKRKVFKGRIWL